MKKSILSASAIVLSIVMVVLSACSAMPTATYRPPGGTSNIPQPTPYSPTYPTPAWPYPQGGGTYAPAPTSGVIGLAAGGAKDVGNFRQNIRNNYLPLPSDVTFEGLFYDYYFDTGGSAPPNKLFEPSYSYAVTKDPLSGKTEYYMSVGLNSGLKESDFQRKALNLVIVLDNSGSMAESFDQYYYDRAGNRRDAVAEERGGSLRKIDSAIDAVQRILGQLNEGDRVSFVVFNSNASLVAPMQTADAYNMRILKGQVRGVMAGGSTNLAAGIDLASRQLKGAYRSDTYEYENRIMVLTDAQPNTGDFSASGLSGMIERNADNRIYTTFIGIGVDFNSQLIEEISKVKGANYYTVRSPREFRERIDDEFEYMVTPLVFNVELGFRSNGWKIEKVFGSPEADQATGRLMSINTMFAAKSEGGENRGGLVLLKLRKTSSNPDEKVFLDVTYEDRDGRQDSSEAAVWLEGQRPEYFDNTGIEKGILLTRYASLLQNWMIDERTHMSYSRPWDPRMSEDTGIIIPDPGLFSQWERQSLPLTVSEPYRRMFRTFRSYFSDEMRQIGDDSLGQELTILNTLAR